MDSTISVADAGGMARPADPQPGLARAIREFRQTAGLTQEDLAHAAGVTVTTLARIEGVRANPAWSTVGQIAAALGITVSQLAERADQLADDSDDGATLGDA
jgi:transcriptional regulator with XRE-family HTH domain